MTPESDIPRLHAPDAGPDPFDAAVARVELEEVADRRATRAAATVRDGISDTEAARAICYFLYLTQRKLGISESGASTDFDEIVRSIVVAAQGGKLPVGEYRCLWDIWKTLCCAPPRA